jgi:citrate synthase
MLREIGSVEAHAGVHQARQGGRAELMGFGHRVYKNYDPARASSSGSPTRSSRCTGRNPLLDIALELERIALQDDYFVKRKLYPNVDFYSGIIYEAMGFPVEMFPVLFAIARTSGWMAQWAELIGDEEQKIIRPKQIYLGHDQRQYVPLDERRDAGPLEPEVRGPALSSRVASGRRKPDGRRAVGSRPRATPRARSSHC